MNLYYTSSPDNMVLTTPIDIMSPSAKEKAWDNQRLYRASFLYENGTYYVFYSGYGPDINVNIRLLQGKGITKLSPFTENLEEDAYE